MMKRSGITAGIAAVATIGLCFTMTGCGQTADSVVSDEVTTAEATQALSESNFNNCKLDGNFVVDMKYPDLTAGTVGATKSYNVTVKMSVVVVDTLMYMDYQLSGNGLEELGQDIKTSYSLYLNSSTNEVYEQNDAGQWVVTTYSASDLESLESILGATGIEGGSISGLIPTDGDFANFKYDSDKKGYVYDYTNDGANIEEIIKFKDSKLAAIITTMSYSSSVYEGSVKLDMLITYGGQSITLPTVA
jgi:hypothetical protein